LAVALIDIDSDSYDAAAAFWQAAIGRTAEPEDEEEYASLGRLDRFGLALQRTGAGTPPRVHLDIETDDVVAEIDRLVGLGAVVTDRRDEYAILADPAGQPFCVVPVQTGADFADHANSWN
jgi:hypothetical protein